MVSILLEIYSQATIFTLSSLIDRNQSKKRNSILDDEPLVLGCKAMEALAQKALYDKYCNKMFHVCLRYLSDHMEAEDAMTEGFVKVFSKIGTFEYRGKGTLEAWLKRIMINESLMVLRKRKHKKVDIDGLLNLDAGSYSDSELEHMEIVKHIHKLPEGYKTVFNLYIIEGYSHKEIGQKLNISENTSKSQLSKARASLIKSLKKSEII